MGHISSRVSRSRVSRDVGEKERQVRRGKNISRVKLTFKWKRYSRLWRFSQCLRASRVREFGMHPVGENRRKISADGVVKSVLLAGPADESVSKQVKDWIKSHSETPSPTSRWTSSLMRHHEFPLESFSYLPRQHAKQISRRETTLLFLLLQPRAI